MRDDAHCQRSLTVLIATSGGATEFVNRIIWLFAFRHSFPNDSRRHGTGDRESKKGSEILHRRESSDIQVGQICLKFCIEHWRAVKRLKFSQNRRAIKKRDILHIRHIASRENNMMH